MIKYAFIAAATANTVSNITNSVPVETTPPGWHYMGSPDAKVKIHMFFDLRCPDCKNEDEIWH